MVQTRGSEWAQGLTLLIGKQDLRAWHSTNSCRLQRECTFMMYLNSNIKSYLKFKKIQLEVDSSRYCLHCSVDYSSNLFLLIHFFGQNISCNLQKDLPFANTRDLVKFFGNNIVRNFLPRSFVQMHARSMSTA